MVRWLDIQKALLTEGALQRLRDFAKAIDKQHGREQHTTARLMRREKDGTVKYDHNELGLICQYGAVTLLGLPFNWEVTAQSDGGDGHIPGLGKLDVKGTDCGITYTTPRLMIPCEDKPYPVNVLAHYNGERTVMVLGWCLDREILEAPVADFGNGDTYCKLWRDLSPIDGLIEHIREYGSAL